MTFHAVVKYSEFYGKPVPDHTFFYLKEYPTDLIISQLSKINSFLYHQILEIISIQQKILQHASPC
jgi:hypothetical protein